MIFHERVAMPYFCAWPSLLLCLHNTNFGAQVNTEMQNELVYLRLKIKTMLCTWANKLVFVCVNCQVPRTPWVNQKAFISVFASLSCFESFSSPVKAQFRGRQWGQFNPAAPEDCSRCEGQTDQLCDGNYRSLANSYKASHPEEGKHSSIETLHSKAYTQIFHHLFKREGKCEGNVSVNARLNVRVNAMWTWW